MVAGNRWTDVSRNCKTSCVVKSKFNPRFIKSDASVMTTATLSLKYLSSSFLMFVDASEWSRYGVVWFGHEAPSATLLLGVDDDGIGFCAKGIFFVIFLLLTSLEKRAPSSEGLGRSEMEAAHTACGGNSVGWTVSSSKLKTLSACCLKYSSLWCSAPSPESEHSWK